MDHIKGECKNEKRVLSVFLVLALMLSVLPMSVFAAGNESITYIDRSWDGKKVVDTQKQLQTTNL